LNKTTLERRQRVPKGIRIFAAGVLLVMALGVQASPAIIPAPPQLAAQGYLLIDATTGTSLVEFNADQRLPPASLTKIMTSYVAAKEIERGTITLDDQVVVSIKAWRMEGSRMFIQEGTKVRLEDILRGIIVQSGNDASVALAEHVAGSEDAFADVMNQYAQQLGMTDTHFVNATGLPDENHYTTANDLSKLTVALINQFPEHYKTYSEKYFTYSEIRQPNRNRLLMRDSSVDGVKTGYTDAAGYCLVASAVRGEMRLLSVVMGASSEESRVAESQKLLTYGFRYFETVHLYRADEALRQVRVWGGQHGTVKLGLTADVVMTIPKGVRDQLQAEIQVQNEIHAPIGKGEQLGALTVSVPDKEDISVPLTALNGVQEAGFFARIWDSILLFFVSISGGDPLEYQP
jgi:D-alanyl-D-alanine carboxypeptidase (penicillin-binding protein 5/6)